MSSWAPTTSTGPSELLHAVRRAGADHRDPRRGRDRRSRPVPQRPAGSARDRVQRMGHDPDRVRQPLRLLHRAGSARCRDQPSVRRHRRRGAVARGRRGHRGHPARPERQQLRARPAAGGAPRRRHRGSLAPSVRRSVDGRRRGAGHPPGAVHQPAPQGHAPRDVSGDGCDTCGVRAPALPAAVGQRSGVVVDAPRLHRRALPRTPGAGPCSRARSGRQHRHHRRLPRRDRRRLRPHPRGGRRRRVRLRLHLPVLAARGHRGRGDDRSIHRSGRGRRALPAAAHRGRAQRPSQAPGTRGSGGRSGRRGAEQEGSFGHLRPYPAEQAGALHARRHLRAGSYAMVEVTAAAPHHLIGEFVELVAEPVHTAPHPVLAGEPVPVHSAGDPRPDGVGQERVGVGLCAAAWARRDPGHRRDAGVSAHGHRHGQAHRSRPCGGAPPLPSIWSSPATTSPSPSSRWRRSASLADIAARVAHAVLVAGTGLYLRGLTDPMEVPGRWPDVRAELERRARPSGSEVLHAELVCPRPAGRSRMEPSNERRVVRARWRWCWAAGGSSARSARGSTTYPPIEFVQIGLRWSTTGAHRAHRRACRSGWWPPGWSPRWLRCLPSRGRCRVPPVRRWATRS